MHSALFLWAIANCDIIGSPPEPARWLQTHFRWWRRDSRVCRSKSLFSGGKTTILCKPPLIHTRQACTRIAAHGLAVAQRSPTPPACHRRPAPRTAQAGAASLHRLIRRMSHVARRHTAMCKAQQFKGSMQALPPIFWRQTMGTASTMCLAWAQRPCSRARTSAGALLWRVFACRPQRGSVSAKLGRCASLACSRTRAGCASCQAQSAKRKSR